MQHRGSLNDAQQSAVLHKEGPLLIVAGAGAGKTRVITERIAELIRSGVAPQEILAVTFTNKAAKEMRERVAATLAQDRELNLPTSLSDRPFVSTFHALGVHIIREHARLLGLTRHFKIYDRSDSVRAIKEAMQQIGLDPKTLEPRKLLGAISRQKGNAVTEIEYAEGARNDFFERAVSGVWREYEKILRAESALDFDDLLLKTLMLLRKNPEILKQYQTQWHYIHIDEYQDTNVVQNELAELLAGMHHNLCVVGDIDQNIYSWRGADLENLLEFEVRHPNTTTVLLEENYRSTKNILAAANDIIRKNKKRKEKTLFTSNAEGERLTLYAATNETEEAD
ncbi:MAG TPA: UvrD-helicase domain-containing protein, partial [Candidatus Paceibacterota bacterium]